MYRVQILFAQILCDVLTRQGSKKKGIHGQRALRGLYSGDLDLDSGVKHFLISRPIAAARGGGTAFPT